VTQAFPPRRRITGGAARMSRKGRSVCLLGIDVGRCRATCERGEARHPRDELGLHTMALRARSGDAAPRASRCRGPRSGLGRPTRPMAWIALVGGAVTCTVDFAHRRLAQHVERKRSLRFAFARIIERLVDRPASDELPPRSAWRGPRLCESAARRLAEQRGERHFSVPRCANRRSCR
jgi:hypothetical protein